MCVIFFICLLWHILFTDPIFSFSPLAIHTRNLLADPRCTLVVQVSYLIFLSLIVLGKLCSPFMILLTVRFHRYLDGVVCQMQGWLFLVMSTHFQRINRWFLKLICWEGYIGIYLKTEYTWKQLEGLVFLLLPLECFGKQSMGHGVMGPIISWHITWS